MQKKKSKNKNVKNKEGMCLEIELKLSCPRVNSIELLCPKELSEILTARG